MSHTSLDLAGDPNLLPEGVMGGTGISPVLVRAGLVSQERTGRINRCRLEAGPILAAAVWMNRYTKYWQAQFDLLAASLEDIENKRSATTRGKTKPRREPERAKRGSRKRTPNR